MTAADKTADQRIAELRADFERDGEDVSHLSDLELLYRHLDMRERDGINTRDRYMALLTDYGKKHDAKIREAGRRSVLDCVDHYARYAITRWIGDLTGILDAVKELPDRPKPERIERLRQFAERTRIQLKDRPGKPIGLYDPTPELDALSRVKGVVGVLEGREHVDAADVLRLVKAAYSETGSLKDLFHVGTDKPREHQVPPFVGEHWTDLRDIYAYQPDGSRAHVKAYAVGDDWYLDLWAERGALLAFGVVPVDEVAALARALVARAGEWARDRSSYPWQRFEQALADARAAEQPAA